MTGELGTEVTERDHTVVLYRDERELVRAVSELAVESLTAGKSVVLFASEAQLEAAEEWIDLSCDPEISPQGCGRYVGIDTGLVADALAAADEPAAAIQEVMARACADAGAEPPLRILGNLSGCLWERGEIALAVSVETLGCEWAEEPGASILCAYPAAAAATEEGVDIMGTCHSAVVTASAVPFLGGPGTPMAPQSARVFPAVPPACRAARRFVREILESAASNDEVIDTIELICSELSANAVRHAHSVFTVELACAPTHVRIAVSDETSPPESAEPFPVRVGHGLGIVAALSRDWGIETSAIGQAVWAEVADDATDEPSAQHTARIDLPTYGELAPRR